MKYVTLVGKYGTATTGYVAIVDDEDYDRVVAQGNWIANVQHHKNLIYVNHCFSKDKKSCAIGLHRYIMGVTDSKILIDHINHNTLDNRKCNLRLSDHKRNNYNSRKRRTSKSCDYKGVDKRSENSYRSQARMDGKTTHLGVYRTPLAAALAYDNEVRKMRGEHGYYNFPQVGEQGITEPKTPRELQAFKEQFGG